MRTACPVVWEGRGREAVPYPICNKRAVSPLDFGVVIMGLGGRVY